MGKPEIKYPCNWKYRIAGQDEESLRNAACSAVNNMKYSLSVSNRSTGGKYQAMSLEVQVKNEDKRLGIFEKLKNATAVKVVI